MPSKKKKYNARFPPARIKKIMQTDEDVGKVAAAVPVIISRALELFIETLIVKSSETTRSRNAKTLSTQHIKQTILAERQFDFLKDLVAAIPDVQAGEEEENSTPPSVSKDTTASTQSASAASSSMEGDAQAARPRGRPKKSEDGVKVPRKARSSDDNSGPPRKRGRPPKRKPSTDESATEDADTEDADEEEEEEEAEDDKWSPSTYASSVQPASSSSSSSSSSHYQPPPPAMYPESTAIVPSSSSSTAQPVLPAAPSDVTEMSSEGWPLSAAATVPPAATSTQLTSTQTLANSPHPYQQPYSQPPPHSAPLGPSSHPHVVDASAVITPAPPVTTASYSPAASPSTLQTRFVPQDHDVSHTSPSPSSSQPFVRSVSPYMLTASAKPAESGPVLQTTETASISPKAGALQNTAYIPGSPASLQVSIPAGSSSDQRDVKPPTSLHISPRPRMGAHMGLPATPPTPELRYSGLVPFSTFKSGAGLSPSPSSLPATSGGSPSTSAGLPPSIVKKEPSPGPSPSHTGTSPHQQVVPQPALPSSLPAAPLPTQQKQESKPPSVALPVSTAHKSTMLNPVTSQEGNILQGTVSHPSLISHGQPPRQYSDASPSSSLCSSATQDSGVTVAAPLPPVPSYSSLSSQPATQHVSANQATTRENTGSQLRVGPPLTAAAGGMEAAAWIEYQSKLNEARLQHGAVPLPHLSSAPPWGPPHPASLAATAHQLPHSKDQSDRQASPHKLHTTMQQYSNLPLVSRNDINRPGYSQASLSHIAENKPPVVSTLPERLNTASSEGIRPDPFRSSMPTAVDPSKEESRSSAGPGFNPALDTLPPLSRSAVVDPSKTAKPDSSRDIRQGQPRDVRASSSTEVGPYPPRDAFNNPKSYMRPDDAKMSAVMRSQAEISRERRQEPVRERLLESSDKPIADSSMKMRAEPSVRTQAGLLQESRPDMSRERRDLPREMMLDPSVMARHEYLRQYAAAEARRSPAMDAMRDARQDAARDVRSDAAWDVRFGATRDVRLDAMRDVRLDAARDVRLDAAWGVRSDAVRDVRLDAAREVRSDAAHDVRLDAMRDVRSDAARNVRLDAAREVRSDAARNVRLDAAREVRSDAARDVRLDAMRDVRLDAARSDPLVRYDPLGLTNTRTPEGVVYPSVIRDSRDYQTGYSKLPDVIPHHSVASPKPAHSPSMPKAAHSPSLARHAHSPSVKRDGQEAHSKSSRSTPMAHDVPSSQGKSKVPSEADRLPPHSSLLPSAGMLPHHGFPFPYPSPYLLPHMMPYSSPLLEADRLSQLIPPADVGRLSPYAHGTIPGVTEAAAKLAQLPPGYMNPLYPGGMSLPGVPPPPPPHMYPFMMPHLVPLGLPRAPSTETHRLPPERFSIARSDSSSAASEPLDMRKSSVAPSANSPALHHQLHPFPPHPGYPMTAGATPGLYRPRTNSSEEDDVRS